MNQHANNRNSTTNESTGLKTNDNGCIVEYSTVGNSLHPMKRPVPRRLLGVWAHPDDEAYLSAGLMAKVIDAGGSVTVVTATRGEKGTDDPSRYDSDEFGQMREGELRHSLAELGVYDVRFLGYRDGECDLVMDEAAVRQISDVIAEVEPDVIVTFGPDGITNHADHRAVSRWTTEATRREHCGELLYATHTHDFVARFSDTNDQIGIYAEFDDGMPRTVGRANVALECQLNDAEIDRKQRALRAHGSQTRGLAELLGADLYREWSTPERYRRPTPAELARCETRDWALARNSEPVLVGAP